MLGRSIHPWPFVKKCNRSLQQHTYKKLTLQWNIPKIWESILLGWIRFKLSIVLHSASVEKISGPGLVQVGVGVEGLKEILYWKNVQMNAKESECFFLPLCDGYLLWPHRINVLTLAFESMTSWRCEISQVTYVADTLVLTKMTVFGSTRHWTSFVKFYMLCTISKETELGDWSSEKEQWCFREVQPTLTGNRCNRCNNWWVPHLGPAKPLRRL